MRPPTALASPARAVDPRSPAFRTAPSALASKIVANVAALGVSQLATWTLTLFWTVVVPRRLGPSGSGLLVLVWSASGLLQAICGLGSRTLLIREIAADRSKAPTLLATALVVRAFLCLPCAGLTLLYIRLGHFDASQQSVLYVAAALTALMLLAEPMQAVFQGIERMQYLAFGEMLNKGVTALAGVLLVLLGFRAIALAWLMVGAAAVILIADWFWVRRYVTTAWRQCVAGVGRFLRQSMIYWAYTLSYTFYLWIDATLVGLLTPSAVLGYYGMPTKLFGTILFVPTILSTAWLPRLSSAFREGEDRFRSAVRAPMELSVVLSLPVAAGVVVVARSLVQTLYGAWFEPAVPVLQILALGAVPMYLNIIVGTVLVAAGRQTTWTVVMGGAGLFNMAANLALIPRFQEQAHNGAVGAALALLATEILIAGAGLIVARSFLSWRVLPRIGRCLGATAGMALVALLTQRFGLIPELAAAALAFAVLAVPLRLLTREERRQAMNLVRRTLARSRPGHAMAGTSGSAGGPG